MKWFDEWFLPSLDRAHIGFLSWESIANFISTADPQAGKAYYEFYERCLYFNRRRGLVSDGM